MSSSRFGGPDVPSRRAVRARQVRLRLPVRHLVVFVIAAVALVAAVFGTFYYAPFLRVADIAVEGVPAQRRPVILRVVASHLGEPLVDVDTDEVGRRVMDTGLFAEVRVSRSWPNTVAIEATPRTPVLVLRRAGSQLRLVDEAGVEYEGAMRVPEGLPIAEAERSDDPAATAALATVARSLRPALRSVTTDLRADSKNRMTLRVNGLDVFWGESVDSHLKAAVVSRLIDTPGVGYIDVSAPMAPVTARHSPTSASQSTLSSGSASIVGPPGPAPDSARGEPDRSGHKSTATPSPEAIISAGATANPG